MSDSADSREPLAPQPATALASLRVDPGKLAQFIEAQNAITAAARNFPGFVGTEVLEPVPGLQEEWVVVFRLESNAAMKNWLESPARNKLAAQIEETLLAPSRMLLLASKDDAEPPAAMVYAHHVAPPKVPAYLEWRRKAIAAQARYPGYLATEFYEPHGDSGEWVDVVRYDSEKNLKRWTESAERAALLKELGTIAESVHAHRVTGLEGWFGINRSTLTTLPPPPWKQAMAVLSALYPTVVLLSLLGSWTQNLSMPIQVLVRNMLSVAALTWFVMPLITRLLWRWLHPTYRTWARDLLGASLVAAGIAGLVVLFELTL